jgi:hypothetical protein
MIRIRGTEWDRATCAAEAADRVRAGELSEPDNHSLDFALWVLELLKESTRQRDERTALVKQLRLACSVALGDLLMLGMLMGASTAKVLQAAICAAEEDIAIAVVEGGTHSSRSQALESKVEAVDPHGSLCTWPIDGRAPGKAARPCNRIDCPHCRPRAAPPEGWRYGVTFPVELEENEAAAIEEELRKKFMPERLKEFSPAAERLLGKMRRVLDKFLDKRREDEALSVSLTDEERQIIRDRRVNMTEKKAPR